MTRPYARILSITFVDGDEGIEPDKITIEVDAQSLAWVGELCGKFNGIMCPEQESSTWYDLACAVFNRFYDYGTEDVLKSPLPKSLREIWPTEKSS